MQILLFLSALLSALSGAIGGVRAEAPAHHAVAQVSVAAAAEVAATRRLANAAPVQSFASAALIAVPLVRFAFSAAAPLYATRLRE